MADQEQQKKNQNQQDGGGKKTAMDENQVVKVRREKLAELQAAGKDPFKITTYDQTEHSLQIIDNFESYENKDVSIAGRIMSKRVMGKASFCNVQDKQGQIQCYMQRDALGDESYKEFKRMDIGDIVGVKGYVFKTKTGEVTVHAKEVTLLSKSLQPLPEKFHGLVDTDIRYRQRYLDLIMNPEVKETFIKRSQIISEIRRFLEARGFMEVETPMLVDNAGGASARPFITHYNALGEDKKLRISLELYLKRLIVGGLEKVFEIGRVFRNEGLDQRHNPEFTLMELYQAYTDYNGMMELTESMFRHLAQTVCGSTTIHYEDKEIDLGKPFRRLTMEDAIKEETGIDFETISTDEEAKKLADEHHIEYEDRHKRGDIINLFFDEYCEDKMIQPTFIMDHPIEISPLTKKKPDDPRKVERFELYINGWEMCNAYSELNDPIDQRKRFEAQDALSAQGDEEAQHTDEDFLHALEIGMPPTGGIGYGIDRLVMLLTDSAAIRDVLLFPTMRSGKPTDNNSEEKHEEEKAEKASAPESAATEEQTQETESDDNGSADNAVEPTPSIPSGEKLDAGISYDDALELLKKYNEDEFHITHGETVAGLMRYYAKKYDPDNEEFWAVVGLLHDLDWEKWQDAQLHTVKTAELLKEAGVNMQVAHAIETHNSDHNTALPKPENKMECVLWACDELSGLLGAIVRMYPSKSAQDLNLKSVKKKFKDKRFAAGCDRDNIRRGAELNDMELDDLFNSMIEAYKTVAD
ncbi:MAG: lysine--tRNA ligase [Bilifractor sp.]|jgi:lysyl-tRNA synthetase class 2